MRAATSQDLHREHLGDIYNIDLNDIFFHNHHGNIVINLGRLHTRSWRTTQGLCAASILTFVKSKDWFRGVRSCRPRPLDIHLLDNDCSVPKLTSLPSNSAKSNLTTHTSESTTHLLGTRGVSSSLHSSCRTVTFQRERSTFQSTATAPFITPPKQFAHGDDTAMTRRWKVDRGVVEHRPLPMSVERIEQGALDHHPPML